MNLSEPKKISVLPYFILVSLLSIPFYFIFTRPLFPKMLFSMPVGTLMVWVPFTVGSLLRFREGGGGAVLALWRRALDFRKIKSALWYVPILLLLPVAHYLAYLLSNLLGQHLGPPTPFWVSPLSYLPMFGVLFLFAIAEEIGWTAYITDPMIEKFGPLGAAVIIGVYWQMWHWPAHLELGKSISWIAWHTVVGVFVRILMVWLYKNNAGCVFACVTLHTTVNLAYRIFPVNGSHYDPFTTTIVLGLVVAVVLFLWRGPNLSDFRPSRPTTSTRTLSGAPS